MCACVLLLCRSCGCAVSSWLCIRRVCGSERRCILISGFPRPSSTLMSDEGVMKILRNLIDVSEEERIGGG